MKTNRQRALRTAGFSVLGLAFVLALGLTATGTQLFAGGSAEGNPARAAGVALEGAGASFPAPLITAMADEYRDYTGGRITVNYQSIGSGGGIRQFIEQTIMFGATERYLSDEQVAEIEASTGGTAFNMPITLGSVAPTYNIPGVDTGLVFTGEVLVDMYRGEITHWNDPRIVELNPGVDLPAVPVQIVHRSDGSGTTNVWTDYFSKVSGWWADNVGFGTSVDWPRGTGANGNEGVAGVVQTTPGALGYNSLVYATLNDIPYGAVINSSGETILPDLPTTSAAANIDLPADTRVSITDTPAADGYPIASFAWVMVYERLDANSAIETREQAEELVRFLYWTITDGQELSEPLDFARLPQAAVDRATDMLRRLTWNGEAVGAEVIAAIAQR